MIAERVLYKGMNYTTVEKGRVVENVMRAVYGTMANVAEAPARSTASRETKTSLAERPEVAESLCIFEGPGVA